MASAKALFGALVGRFLFREATASSVRTIGAKFRHIELAGAALKGVEWTPGDKVQLYLADAGMRTYTPLTWDRGAGTTSFLAYVHATPPTTPGARWAAGLEKGAVCSLFGPRGSIAFPALDDGAVFVGDETSFAAAIALRDVKPKARLVFEVDDAAESKEVLAAFGIADATVIQRERGDAHLEAMAKVLAEHSSAPTMTLTGRAQSIQVLRAHLKAAGALRPGKSKAYWSVGKAGLD